MDPEASELVLPSDPVKVGTAAEFTVCTKDQDGKPVFVEGMKVRRGGRGYTSCPVSSDDQQNSRHHSWLGIATDAIPGDCC